MAIVRIPLHSRKYPDKFALVDEEDAERVLAYRWYPVKSKAGVFYAESYGRDALASGETRQRMHRLVMDLAPGEIADHINGDGLDNRRANLRRCSPLENARNARGWQGSESRFKGVCRRGDRWRAAITVERKRVSLGDFSTEEEAAKAYDLAAQRFHREFARLNFPESAIPVSEIDYRESGGSRAEELGRIVRVAWVEFVRIYPRDGLRLNPSHVAPWEAISDWDREADRRIGLAVERFVCPPDHVVVPKAEHDALMETLGWLDEVTATPHFRIAELSALAEWRQSFHAYRAAIRAALATEPTPGKETSS